MSITRSYNKRSGVWYAYEVQYVWDEATKKKKAVRKCIGKFDPVTDEIVPNGKRGPKPVKTPPQPKKADTDDTSKQVANVDDTLEQIADTFDQQTFDKLTDTISDGFNQLSDSLHEIVDYLKVLSSQDSK
jgi:hypothetical protein